jgi:hypothetical protein
MRPADAIENLGRAADQRGMTAKPDIEVPLRANTVQRLEVGEGDVAVASPGHRERRGGKQGAQNEDQRYQHDQHRLVLPIRAASPMRPIGRVPLQASLTSRVPGRQTHVPPLFCKVKPLCGEGLGKGGEMALDFLYSPG